MLLLTHSNTNSATSSFKRNSRTLTDELNCQLFSSLAILNYGLGLFGLASYTSEQRTKEIGIRKVLGATVSSLVGLMSKDFRGSS
jgi:ABC-type antimicrobial peptide transport system permease subunit